MHREATKWLSGWVEEDRGCLSWKEVALVQAPVQMPKPVDEQCYWWPAPAVTSGYREVTLAGAFDTQDGERRLLHLLSFYKAARYAFPFTLWRQANPPRAGALARDTVKCVRWRVCPLQTCSQPKRTSGWSSPAGARKANLVIKCSHQFSSCTGHFERTTWWWAQDCRGVAPVCPGKQKSLCLWRSQQAFLAAQCCFGLGDLIPCMFCSI